TAAPIAAPAADLPPAPELLADEEFRKGNCPQAATWYTHLAAANRGAMTAQRQAAWAYCRVKLAADRVNAPGCDPAAAAAAEKDVAEALRLAPTNADLQRVGQAVLAVARQRQVNPARPGVASPGRQPGESPIAVPADWEAIETPSFRVRFKGTRELAQAVA